MRYFNAFMWQKSRKIRKAFQTGLFAVLNIILECSQLNGFIFGAGKAPIKNGVPGLQYANMRKGEHAFVGVYSYVCMM